MSPYNPCADDFIYKIPDAALHKIQNCCTLACDLSNRICHEHNTVLLYVAALNSLSAAAKASEAGPRIPLILRTKTNLVLYSCVLLSIGGWVVGWPAAASQTVTSQHGLRQRRRPIDLALTRLDIFQFAPMNRNIRMHSGAIVSLHKL